VDLELQRQCAENDNLVFDSWALPWLAAGSAVKIWLESSAESRVRKSIVSHLGHGLSDAAVGELVARKDREARELFLSLYKFDIFEDRSVFDLAVDISRFVAEPTPQMCRESIRRTGELLEAFVGWAVYREPGCRMDFARLVRDSVGQVRLADCWAQELSEG
jgi:cytidylate kinase